MSNHIQAKLEEAVREQETCTDEERLDELDVLIEHYKKQLRMTAVSERRSEQMKRIKEQLARGEDPEELEELEGEDEE